MDKPSQILAALKKLGPSSPRVIADSTGIDPSVCGYQLRLMLKAGTIKSHGKTSGVRYALPDQEFEAAQEAPPQAVRKSKGKGKKKKQPKAKGARPRAAAPAEFIPAIDAQMGLVCFGGEGDPIRFSAEQTGKIAELLFTHYEP